LLSGIGSLSFVAIICKEGGEVDCKAPLFFL